MASATTPTTASKKSLTGIVAIVSLVVAFAQTVWVLFWSKGAFTIIFLPFSLLVAICYMLVGLGLSMFFEAYKAYSANVSEGNHVFPTEVRRRLLSTYAVGILLAFFGAIVPVAIFATALKPAIEITRDVITQIDEVKKLTK